MPLLVRNQRSAKVFIGQKPTVGQGLYRSVKTFIGQKPTVVFYRSGKTFIRVEPPS